MTTNSKKALHSLVKLLVEQTKKQFTTKEAEFFDKLELFQHTVEGFKKLGTWTGDEIDHFMELSDRLWARVQANPNDIVLHKSEQEFDDLQMVLTKLIAHKERATLNPNKAPKPEAPNDAPFGKYLFAPDRKDLKGKVNEPNTPEENKFLYSLIYHYDGAGGPGPALDKFAPMAIDLLKKGEYKKILAPPKRTVYRLLWNVSPKLAASILRLGVKDITTNSNQAWYVDGGGTIEGIRRSIQSWTTTIGTEWVSSLFDESLKSGNVAIVLAAHTETDGNEFFINPKTAENISSLPQSLVKKEQEVISYGPVNFFEASFYYKTVDKSQNQLEKIIREVEYAGEKMIKHVDYSIETLENAIAAQKQAGEESYHWARSERALKYLRGFKKTGTIAAKNQDYAIADVVDNLPTDIMQIIKNNILIFKVRPKALVRLYFKSLKYGGPSSKEGIKYIQKEAPDIIQTLEGLFDSVRNKEEVSNVLSQLSKTMKFKLKK